MRAQRLVPLFFFTDFLSSSSLDSLSQLQHYLPHSSTSPPRLFLTRAHRYAFEFIVDLIVLSLASRPSSGRHPPASVPARRNFRALERIAGLSISSSTSPSCCWHCDLQVDTILPPLLSTPPAPFFLCSPTHRSAFNLVVDIIGHSMSNSSPLKVHGLN